ncbi:HAMP domain-containing histidine kinase [Candidatus Daviesbacteria bacterium]|nr:HAMP domain-containing histidine kinase [Candidatus Daviesbacteria bacterium]
MIILVSVGLLAIILIINFFYNQKTKDLEERNKRLVVLTQENTEVNQQLRNTLSLLAKANDRLKELDRLKDDFVSIASHELRTPMTAIRSYAWMALHRSDVPLSKTLEKYIVRVLVSTERLINLVNDMLNVSRIEAGKIEINPEPIDPLLLIKDIVDEVYYSKSEEKKIEFEILEKQCPKIFADPEKLRQVFLNLVGNSLKFTPDGGKISFDFFCDGKTVEIAVLDTGIGISKDDLSKLFHKFGRLDNSYTATATSGGTGLGLYVSKSLIELMHGKIRAYSQGINKGSVFIVSVPVATPETLKNIDSFRIKPKGEAKGLEPVAI